MDEPTPIYWENPSPVGGQTARTIDSGVNENDQSGEITFVLLEEVETGRWIEVADIEASVQLEPMANWSVVLDLPTEPVEESEIHRYQLIARDRHIDIDWVTIEPIEVKPYTARDGRALSSKSTNPVGCLYCTSLLLHHFVSVYPCWSYIDVKNRPVLMSKLESWIDPNKQIGR